MFETKTFDNKNTEITANETSFDKKKSEFSASGNVRIVSKFKNGDRFEALGRFARYNATTGKGKIWGKNTLVKYFVKAGDQQLQLNVLDVETLQDAVKNPDTHRNLVVRVWGWSAYFCELAPEYQQHIIHRHQYRG
jgi:lipopolysaccharide export system protein LptA